MINYYFQLTYSFIVCRLLRATMLSPLLYHWWKLIPWVFNMSRQPCKSFVQSLDQMIFGLRSTSMEQYSWNAENLLPLFPSKYLCNSNCTFESNSMSKRHLVTDGPWFFPSFNYFLAIWTEPFPFQLIPRTSLILLSFACRMLRRGLNTLNPK
jgi:hypothetical protein